MKVIFWDFDGVILDSNEVRDKGFLEVLKEFPEDQVEALLAFHRKNGGLSRYVKFRYFFEEIRGESISDEEILKLSEEFSVIMKRLLTNPELLIKPINEFLIRNKAKRMHIVSGSDQDELRYLCKSLGIDKYFISIHGSPTPKIQLVQNVLESERYERSNCVLIGDSINDFEAAKANGIDFYGFGNESIAKFSTTIVEGIISTY